MDIDVDYDSDSMSMGSEPPSPTSTAPLEPDGTMRSASPSSVWSMSSSLREAAYREQYGRKLNNYSEIYNFPADDVEYGRQDLQHATVVEMTGAKYCPPMEEVLTPQYPGDVKACLDLGFGSGKWMIKAAQDFPHVEFLGVDLVPVITESDLPPNCRAEVDDINLGLQHFYGAFDVVRASLISFGIRDYPNLIDEIAHILRPGGLIDLAETDLYVYDEKFQRLDFAVTELKPPWWPRFLTLVREATKAVGGTPGAGAELYDLVKQHPAFEDIHFNELWLPGSAWRENYGFIKGKDRHTLEDGLAYIDSSRPLLLRRGHPEDLVDLFSSKAKEELKEGRVPCYARLYTVYARRRSKGDVPPTEGQQ